MKILHIPTGTFCIIAPERPFLDNPEKECKWLIDIDYKKNITWTKPTTDVSIDFWNYLWDTNNISVFWFSTGYIRFSDN